MSPALAVPDDLRDWDQFVLWLNERRNGTTTKVPQQINGRRADSTDSRTWTSLELVMECWGRFPKRYAGIGFVFSINDPFCGVDLDNCLEMDGSLKSWARSLVEHFDDTYMEASPSGRGIKFWCRAKLPANLGKVAVGDGGIEMYDHARFFTLTGRVFRGSPLQVEDHAVDILTLYEKLRGGSGHRQRTIEPSGRIPHGHQHLTLVSLAGTMWRAGMCTEAIEAALQVVNSRQCERPGDPANIRRIVNSIRNWRRS